MRELKDQLCTLLITFSDGEDPTKEVTAAHTFASTDPSHYPQHRRVVHSRHTEERDGRDSSLSEQLSVERISQSALSVPFGALGSDMVEHRRVLSSPPGAYGRSAQVRFPQSAHSPSAEKQRGAGAAESTDPNNSDGRPSSHQLRHSATSDDYSSSARHSPYAGSLLSIHEVSLTYTRSSATDPLKIGPAAAAERRPPPKPIGDAKSSPTTTFPSSGSVQVNFSEARPIPQPLYTVTRPEADFAFGAGELVQISDGAAPPTPKKREMRANEVKQVVRAPATVELQQLRPDAEFSVPLRLQTTAAGERQQQKGPITGREEGRAPPPMPVPPHPPHPPHGDVLSHKQSRSFESSEESSMRSQRAKGKSRTVFEKTTCELLTEKSVTTFAPKHKRPTTRAPAQPPSPATRTQPPQHSQQPRGLPRFRHEEETEGVHLYTMYDDERGRQRASAERPQPREKKAMPRVEPPRGTMLVTEHSRVQEEVTTKKSWRGGGAAEPQQKKPAMVPFGSARSFRESVIIRREQTAPLMPPAAAPESQPAAPAQPPPRLIDFETYKREVEQLQRQAAAIGESRAAEIPKELEVPLVPAVVVAPKQTIPKATETIKYFSREEMFAKKKAEPVLKQEEEEEKERKRIESQLVREERLRRMEEERTREEKAKQMEEEWMREVQRRREEADKAEEERKLVEEEMVRQMERRRAEEAERRRRAEEEMARREAERKAAEERERAEQREERRRRMEERARQEEEERRAAAERQQQLFTTTTAETFHSVEQIVRAVPSQVQEQVQLLPLSPTPMVERAMPVERGREMRAQVMQTHQEELPPTVGEEKKPGEEGVKTPMEPEEDKQLALQETKEPPVEYFVDTSDMGKRLFETLRRELQYEEEVDTLVKRRRRPKGDQGEEEEGEEEGEGVPEAEIIEEEEGAKAAEGEGPKEPAEEEAETTEFEETEEYMWWEKTVGTGQLKAIYRRIRMIQEPAQGFVPIHRHGVSGELSLPPLIEEEEETSFEEGTVIETSSVHTLPSAAGVRKRVPPPIPPPKPAYSTTFSSEPRYRDSSFSSAYSYFPPTPTSHTYTMEYSPVSSDYRSAISSRQNFPRARPLSPISHGGHSRVLKMVSETSSLSSRPISPYPGSIAASTIRDAREREKKEMSDLNDRLASYIEKVRFLEAQNRKLAADLNFLRNRWGRDASNMRDMYEADLRQAKKVIDETQRQKDDLEKKAKAMADDMAELKTKNEGALRAHDEDKERMEELLLKLAAMEAELAALKRRLAILEEDVKALKRENQRMGGEMQKARTDLDQETLNRIDYQNQVQTLLEEIDFLRRAHDAEIQDLQAMASRDTTGENREYFRNELAAAIRDIRAEYDTLNSRNKTDIESWYKLKVQEIQTQSARQSMEQTYAKEELKRLRNQLGDLRGKLADLEGRNSLLEKQAEELAYQLEDDQRAYESALNDKDAQIRKIRDECQTLMVELQMLLDTKQSLDAEIAIYRKMLEGEEDRAGLRQLVEQVVKTHQIKQSGETESTRVLRGEKSSRQSYQRSAKGNVSILETSPEGKYVVLENTHRSKEEPIGEWKLKRRIDGKRDIVYTIPPNFVLRPGKTVKIWARNQGVHAPPDQLVFDGEESFGVGSNVQTILYNRDGEERASLIQRSSR